MKNFSNFVINFRWFIIIGFLAITVAFMTQLPKAEIDSNVKSQLPADMGTRLTLDKIEDIFGGTEMAIIVLETDDVLNKETLKRVKKISRDVERIKGVDRVLSLFELKNIKSEYGSMIVDPAVKRIPRNDKQTEELRHELINNDIVYGVVVSEDFTATSIIALLKANVNDTEIVNEIRQVVNSTEGDEKVHLGGFPVIRTHVSSDIQQDMRRLMPFGLLIMLVFLFLCFRQIRGVLLPFFVVLMSIMVGMALIPILGWKIQSMTVIAPVILIAIANDYGIHILSRFQEDNHDKSRLTNKELAKEGIMSLGKPVILTGITTVAGMLSLLTHIIVPAEQIGIIAAVGIVFALLASLMFIPAILSLLPVPKPVIKSDGKKHFIERMLESLATFVTKAKKGIIISSIFITVIIALGIQYIIVDTNPVNYYSKDSDIVKTSDVINEKFGGSTSLSIVAEGDIKNANLMKKIDKLENDVKKLEHVGNTTSIARVVKQMSRALNDSGEVYYDKIPDSRNAVAQYFELYSMSGEPDDFEKLVDFPYEHAQITARIQSSSSGVIKSTVNDIKKIIGDDKDFTLVGGFAAIFSELSDKVIEGQVTSLLLSVVIVFILMVILFKSLTAGILSILPLALSLILLFGTMGFTGVELNIATAMLSSIMIGVGIDYTIHFLWRFKIERGNGLSHENAVIKTLTTTGRGILFNALSVIIGFAALMISNFMPVKFFGVLVVMSIFTCLVGAMVLLPVIIIYTKPKFLDTKV